MFCSCHKQLLSPLTFGRSAACRKTMQIQWRVNLLLILCGLLYSGFNFYIGFLTQKSFPLNISFSTGVCWFFCGGMSCFCATVFLLYLELITLHCNNSWNNSKSQADDHILLICIILCHPLLSAPLLFSPLLKWSPFSARTLKLGSVPGTQ